MKELTTIHLTQGELKVVYTAMCIVQSQNPDVFQKHKDREGGLDYDSAKEKIGAGLPDKFLLMSAFMGMVVQSGDPELQAAVSESMGKKDDV